MWKILQRFCELQKRVPVSGASFVQLSWVANVYQWTNHHSSCPLITFFWLLRYNELQLHLPGCMGLLRGSSQNSGNTAYTFCMRILMSGIYRLGPYTKSSEDAYGNFSMIQLSLPLWNHDRICGQLLWLCCHQGPPDLTMTQSTRASQRQLKGWLYPFCTGRPRVYCTPTIWLGQSAHSVTFPLPHGPAEQWLYSFHMVQPKSSTHRSPYHIYHLPIW